MWLDAGKVLERIDDSRYGQIDRVIAPPHLAQKCRIEWCSKPGEHEGLCALHFWRATAGEKSEPVIVTRSDIPGRYRTLVDAYRIIMQWFESVPERKWLDLREEFGDLPTPDYRRIRRAFQLTGYPVCVEENGGGTPFSQGAPLLPRGEPIAVDIYGGRGTLVWVQSRSAGVRVVRERLGRIDHWKHALKYAME